MKIRLKIDECSSYEEVEIIIKCPKIDHRLAKIIEIIQQSTLPLIGVREGRTYKLAIENIYYIESVDNKTFLYDDKDVYDCNLKLYELEKILKETRFIRISKNLILNIAYVESVKALFNGRFEAMLSNDEKVIINRHYVKGFKEKIMI